MAMKRLGLILGAALFLCASVGWLPFPVSGHAAAEPPVPADAPVYVELAPLVLPVIDGDRIQQLLQFTITVEAADEKAAGRIRDVQPRLTDAYIQDLYGALERRRLLDGKILDVARLRDELTRISTGVLGENAFRAILIQRVSQRMM
jgi:flagellar FliL protein